ncbi:MAG: response regulator transcription factor [Chloroflexota bacterium]
MAHLLIVDDEKHFRTTLIRALKSQGYRATGLADADSLPSALAIHRPDLVLLDLMFESGASGLDVCRGLRSWTSIPVIIVSVASDEATKIKALDAGADDYLVKPFSIEELIARVKAVQRRLARTATNESMITVGNLTVDFNAQLVTMAKEVIHLTRNEYKLLTALIEAEGQSVSYSTLLTRIYGGNHEGRGERSSIRILVRQLRRKLGEDLSNPTYLLTESGLGYRFNMNPETTIQAAG